MGKLYPNDYAKYPVADLHIYSELVPALTSVFTHANIIQQENQSQKKLWATLSCLQYIQYAADLLSLTTHPNSSQCFFCASLSWPLLAAVPINISLHDLHGTLPTRKAQNILLFDLLPPPLPCRAFLKTPSYMCHTHSPLHELLYPAGPEIFVESR